MVLFSFLCLSTVSQCCGLIITKLCGQVGWVIRTSQYDFCSGPDADPAYQWDTKCKLFSLVEVCALPGAILDYMYEYAETCAAQESY